MDSQRIRSHRIDDGRPLVLWRRQDAERAEGFVVAPLMCANPECPCCEMALDIQAICRDGVEKPTVGPTSFTATFSADNGNIETNPDKPSCFTVEETDWILRQLRGEHNDWLRERWKRGRGRITAELGELPEDWKPGTLIAYDRVFPFDWDLTVVHEKHLFCAVDQYCPKPICSCERFVLDFYDMSTDGRRLGQADATLSALLTAKVEGEPVASQLWSAFLDQHGLPELRRRHVRLRNAAARTPPPEPHRIEKKIGRNDPCPCGSGKKFKRCCSRDNARA